MAPYKQYREQELQYLLPELHALLGVRTAAGQTASTLRDVLSKASETNLCFQ